MTQQPHFWVFTLDKWKHVHTKFYENIYKYSIPNLQKWKQLKCPSMRGWINKWHRPIHWNITQKLSGTHW